MMRRLAVILGLVGPMLSGALNAEEPVRPTPPVVPVPVPAPAPALPTGDVAALAVGGGTLFVGMFDRGLVRVDSKGAIERVDDAALNPNINALAWDGARHALWIATARGLVRCNDTKPAACRRVGSADGMHAVLVTKSGRIVAGGDGNLTFATPEGKLEGVVTRKAGAPYRAVWALAEAPDGTLFVGTTSGLYWGSPSRFLDAKAPLKRAAMVSGELPDDWVTALAYRDSRLFVGTYNAGVVSFRHDTGTLAQEGADPSLGYVNPAGITLLPGGELAISTMDGLRVGTLAALRTVPTLGRDVTATAVGEGGERWVASRRGIERLPNFTAP